MDDLQNHIHECDQMPKLGISVHTGDASFGNDDPSWYLTVQKTATEEDLEENHHLEEVGDIIWMTMIEIKYCPYCGEKLPYDQSQSKDDDFGYFHHADFSKWHKRC